MNEKLEKIRKLNQQAWDLCKKDVPRAYQLAQQAQALLAGCPEARPGDEYECLKTQANCLDMLSQPEEALLVGLKANRLAEKIGDKYLIGSIQSLLGRIYWHIDDSATSIGYYLNALNLIQNENYPDLEMSLINGLGLVQFGLENYNASLDYFMACLQKAAETDLAGRGDANNNIANVLHMQGRDHEAVDYAEAGLAIFTSLGAYAGKLHSLHILAATHFSLRNYEKAMGYLQEGLKLARKNNSQLLELTYVSEISRMHMMEGKLDLAEGELLQALQVAERINSLTNISLIHERLTDIYKEKGDYKAALEHFENFHGVFKKIFNEKSDRRIKNLEILNQVESARKQAELYRELAGTDSMTDLVNHGRFMEIAEGAIRKAGSQGGQLAIIMADIDHFKSVNDQHGHLAGDHVLASVASSLKKSLRGEGVAGRYGGEEFVILVCDATVAQCLKIAERIRRVVAHQTIRMGRVSVNVTISLGLACMAPGSAQPLDELINRADQALYEAKQLGRNQAVLWKEKEEIASARQR